jgi:tRNA(fMet)-specific endonuclease VapC
MSAVLVDTDVFSFLFKGHSFAALYDADLHGKSAALSFMTVAELDRWAIQSKWGEARRNWLRLYMEPFSILAYHRALCTKWAEVMVAAQSRGHRIECADAWIAATALLYDLPLVTHNRGDYRGVPGLTIISHGG